MGADLPDYYFRIREKGAAVFRVDTENRQRRIDMDQIAVANVVNGQIKPNGSRELSAQDIEVIQNWMANRIAVLAERAIDDIHRAIDHMNLTTQWVQSTATDAQLDDVSDDILLAMHDLRSALVRKRSDRLMAASKDD